MSATNPPLEFYSNGWVYHLIQDRWYYRDAVERPWITRHWIAHYHSETGTYASEMKWMDTDYFHCNKCLEKAPIEAITFAVIMSL